MYKQLLPIFHFQQTEG